MDFYIPYILTLTSKAQQFIFIPGHNAPFNIANGQPVDIQNIKAKLHPTDNEQFETYLTTIKQGKAITFNFRLKDGNNRFLNVFNGVTHIKTYNNDTYVQGYWQSEAPEAMAVTTKRPETEKHSTEKLVYEISSRFINVASFDVDNQIIKSFQKICEFTGTQAAFIYLFRDVNQLIELSHCWIEGYTNDIENRFKWIPIEESDWLYIRMHEEKIFANDLSTSKITDKSLSYTLLLQLFNPTILCTSLIFQGNVIGFIGLSTTNTQKLWNENDTRLLQLIGEIYVSALQRKEAIKVLLEGERAYREIYNATSDAIVVIDVDDFLIIDVNNSFTELFGYNYTDHPDLTIDQICSNDKGYGPVEFQQLVSRATKTGILTEWHTKNKQGRLFWTELSVKTAELHGMERIICAFKDISERKKSELMLRNSEERFRNIVQQLSDMVFILDPAGKIIYTTPSAENSLGYSLNTLYQKNIIEIIHSEDIALFTEMFDNINRNTKTNKTYELRFVHNNGKNHTAEVVGSNMLKNMAIKGNIITCRDITERKNTERRILDAVIKTEEHERERFAKNLHDDLGPLLSSLKMYLGMFSKMEEGNKRDYVVEQLEGILKEAIQTTKDISNDLSPHVLTNYGLSSAIDTFINKVGNATDIEFENDVQGVRFEPRIENSLYRISKELINNSLKHAMAHKIKLKLKEKGSKLILKYTDDGKGLQTDNIDDFLKKGMGMSNIISRAKSLNASYKFQGLKTKGFGIEIKVPLI